MKSPTYKVISLDGDPCPRCKQGTEVREHVELTDKHLRQPFYYSRWFNCNNPGCQTKQIMPSRFKVERDQRVDWGG
jgi:hypothetical protein